MLKTRLASAINITLKPHSITLAAIAIITPILVQANDGQEQETIQIIGIKQTLASNVAQSTMRSETDLSTVPRSVQVINNQIIEQQEIQSLSDAAFNVSNVSEDNSYGGTRDQFKIRGFSANIYEDGTRVNGVAQDKAVVEDLEFIEVVKGPESVLYGNMSPGGLINLISKRPQAESQHQIRASFDEHGKQRYSLDLTGAANEQESIMYRLVGVFDDSEGWRDASDSKQIFIAPSLTWSITDNTALTLAYKYNKEELPFDRGTLAVRNANNGWTFLDIDERRLGSKFSRQDRKVNKYSLELEHAFNYNWTTRLKARYQEREYQGNRVHFYASSAAARIVRAGVPVYREDGTDYVFDGTINRYIVGNDQSSKTTLYSWENNIDFTTGAAEHRVVAGLDYTQYKENSDTQASYSWSDPDTTVLSGLIFRTPNPNSGVYNFYSGNTLAANHPNDLYNLHNDEKELTEYSVFAQDLIEWGDWHFVIGARYDVFKGKAAKTWTPSVQQGASLLNVMLENEDNSSPKEENISVQLGALYALNQQVSLFANVTDTYLPNQKYDEVKNKWVDAQHGTQYELGTKLSLLDNRLNLTSVIYHIELDNIAFNGDVPGSFDVYKQRSRGFEIDGDLALGSNLSALFSYGYTDVEFVNAPDTVNNPVNVAKHNASVWLAYQASQEWGLGSGIRYVGERDGNRRKDYDYTLADYTLVDLAAWYTPSFADKNLRIQLNAKNIFDEEYFTAGSDSTQNAIYLGSPRTVSLSASYNF